ncbi:DMT family transporter [Ruegeria sp. 2012CJ41-6]|uniref:DMT family transporter n=1 Tax=Ruegeria spongiae TaxID=2942209 RepID=A0ABT0Q233_9RHOB|nr:DMT family transporter [Ruegeria spongiae]MCL6283890.1 DMT family transporter [Ruegeria spongiae]
MPSSNKYVEAILWVLLSTALFTVVFAAAKFADGAIGTFQILLLRYIGSFVTVSWLVVRSGSFNQYKSNVPFQHFLRAVFGCSAAAAITWATAHMPVADASAIGILYGVITVLLGVLFLKGHVGIRHWLAIAISLAGAGLIMAVQGAFQSHIAGLPAFVALLSAFLMASEGLLIRTLSQTESALSMMLYVSGFGILLLSVPTMLEWRNISATLVVGCVALGPLSVAAQYCTIRGYRIAPLSVVGPVDYSWLIFAMILGFVVFGEHPSIGAIAGGILIVSGGILLSNTRAQQ